MDPKDAEPKFAVLAEVRDYPKPLILADLTFARLVDEILVPLEVGDKFFLDGVPTTKEKLLRIKILKQRDTFHLVYDNLHHKLRWGDLATQKLYADQYPVRLDAALRENCEDVTSQVIRAFDSEVKPKLRDYLPNRQQLVAAALKVFEAATTALLNSRQGA